MAEPRRFPDGSLVPEDIFAEQPKAVVILMDPDDSAWSRYGALAAQVPGCMLIAVDCTLHTTTAISIFRSLVTLVAIAPSAEPLGLIHALAHAVDRRDIRVIGYTDDAGQRKDLIACDLPEVMTSAELAEAIAAAFAAIP